MAREYVYNIRPHDFRLKRPECDIIVYVTYSVYAIVDPRSSRVFYIGQTAEFALRCSQHLESGDTIAGLLIQEMSAAGRQPNFVVLEECTSRRRALMAEIFWMDLFASRGASLANAQAFDGYADRARRKGEFAPAAESMLELTARANGRPLREGRRWTLKEEAMMRRLLREGRSKFEVADRLDRSVGAIEERWQGRTSPRKGMSGSRPGKRPSTEEGAVGAPKKP